MTSPLRAVLDTNVVLSALVFGGGVGGQARAGWQRGAFVPLVSTATAQELVRVLAYPKFHLSAMQQQELLADYLPYTQTVRMPTLVPHVPACRDPQDMPFMQLAIAGKAHMLVTGDRDLLSIASAFEQASKCRMMVLEEFCQIFT